MCFGLPMVVVEQGPGPGQATCERRGEKRIVNMMLTGDQPEGTIVLVHIESAQRILDEEEASQINDAIDAVEAVLRGEQPDVDKLFADITESEPQLPPHLRH
ncbi:MAG: HypC/HybG/HupF family hydrogenase formation chaperone [Magnetovibrionaceae bacterium]